MLAWGCGPEDAANEGSGGVEQPDLCIAGRQVGCDCPGGQQGTQTCRDDGQGYGRCECGGGPPDEPGEECPATVCPVLNVECPSISECDSVLASNARVSTQVASSEYAAQKLYFRDWLCDAAASASLFEWARQESRGGGVNVGLPGVLTFGFNANQSEAEQRREFETWQRTRCTEEVQDLSDEQVASYLARIEDTTASLRAWSACVSDVMGAYLSCRGSAGGFSDGNGPAVQGLMLVAQPSQVAASEGFQLRVRWCGLVGSVSPAQAQVVDFSIEGAECTRLERVGEGELLCQGDITLQCRRLGTQAVRASMDIRVGSAGAFRDVSAWTYMPPLCGQTDGPCCTGARCALPGDQCISGWCSSACPRGQRRCDDGICEAESATSCGPACTVCEAPAGARAACVAGRCDFTCPPGTSECGGVCRDLDEDEQNCGRCGTRCSADEICANGQCTCPPRTILCDGVCAAECPERCDGLDNDQDGGIDEGGVCNVVTVGWFSTACDGAGCRCGSCSDCPAGRNHSGRLYQTEGEVGCYDIPGDPHPREGVELVPGPECNGTYTVSFHKLANCGGEGDRVVRSVTYGCNEGRKLVNFNCWDGNGDGSGDFDGNVVSIHITTNR